MNKGAMNIPVNICTHLSYYILGMQLLGYRVGMYLTLETIKGFFKMVILFYPPFNTTYESFN